MKNFFFQFSRSIHFDVGCSGRFINDKQEVIYQSLENAFVSANNSDRSVRTKRHSERSGEKNRKMNRSKEKEKWKTGKEVEEGEMESN